MRNDEGVIDHFSKGVQCLLIFLSYFAHYLTLRDVATSSYVHSNNA